MTEPIIKIFLFDSCGYGLTFATACVDAGHDVRWWIPKGTTGEDCPTGNGMIHKVSNWVPWMGWADLIVLTDNPKYQDRLDPFFKKGYPIFGCNREASLLELDRGIGQSVLEKSGIDTLPYEIFTNYDQAIDYVKRTRGRYVSKPWGDKDKALSYVSKNAHEMVFKLSRWKKEAKLKDKFILQEAVDGIEMAVGAWFGPAGFSKAINHNFEEKKLMNDSLGQNTEEMGTTIAYTEKSKLFAEVLQPCEEQLKKLGYVGYIDMNCIVADKPWPLEFTMRFGWPHFNIIGRLHEGDPATWMLDLLQGRDTLKVSKDIAVGVVMATGDFPHGNLTGKQVCGYPIYGVTPENREQLCYLDVMDGLGPLEVDGEIQSVAMPVSAGDNLMTVVGTGKTVRKAAKSAYAAANEISWPGTKYMRTDISRRLEGELPELQAQGYAEGMDY